MSDFRNVGNLLIFREKSSRSQVCAVKMTMYVQWTCININRKDPYVWDAYLFLGMYCVFDSAPHNHRQGRRFDPTPC